MQESVTVFGLLIHAGESPDSKVHGANMGPTWVLSAPDGPHVGPMNLAIRVVIGQHTGELGGECWKLLSIFDDNVSTTCYTSYSMW